MITGVKMKAEDMLSLDYIAGLFDGEGSVVVRFKKDERYKAGYQLMLKVTLPQKSKELLEKVRDTLNMGKLYYHRRDELWYLEIYNIDDLFKFTNLMKGRVFLKREKLTKLSRIICLMKKKRHLSLSGIKFIMTVWRTPETGDNPR